MYKGRSADSGGRPQEGDTEAGRPLTATTGRGSPPELIEWIGTWV